MKEVKRIVCLAIAIIMLVILPSCATIPDGYEQDGEFIVNSNPTALVIILGRHANAMAIPNDAYLTIESLLRNSVYGGHVSVIVSDGRPTLVDLVERNFFAENARNEAILNREINRRVSALSELIRDNSTITAQHPENDLLEAIREATNVLSSSGINEIADKQIIIVDTGITTIGELNFARLRLLQSRPSAEEVVERFRNVNIGEDNNGINVLPNLNGVRVTFIGTADGMAEVAEPQKLGITDKKYVRDFWTAVVKACGASEVAYESVGGWNTANIFTEDYDSIFPFVTPIAFDHIPILVMPEIPTYDINDPDNPPELPQPPSFTVRLGSETVGFIPDSAEFLNHFNAVETLRPYSESIREFIEVFDTEQVWVIGTTSPPRTGDYNTGVDLGIRRAETVRDVLVNEFKIPADRLNVIGLGARFPWSVDAFRGGDFDTNIAQFNRAVWLMSANEGTEEFNMLKEAHANGDLLPEAKAQFEQLWG